MRQGRCCVRTTGGPTAPVPKEGRPATVPSAGPLSGQPDADLRLCEADIQGVPYTLPAKLPGQGAALYATHEIVSKP